MMSKVYSHVLVIISLLFGIIPYAVASDCDTLTSFYNSIKGSLLEDFKVYTDCCNMLGVTCESGQVTEIEVSNTSNSDADFKSAISVATGFSNLKKLTITDTKSKNGIVLPDNIGKFKKIESLIINNNSSENKNEDSTSTIPESIGDLETLEVLDLSNNDLSGSIPKSMKKLKNLKKLNLSGNNLSGTIPYDMKDLKNLNEIKLNNNEKLEGYAPLFEDSPSSCSYSGTNLCQLKSDKCAYGISGCTIQEIQKTNKENGAPSASTYESEVSTNRNKKNVETGSGIGGVIVLLIIGYVWYKCGCCCCHSSTTRVYTVEETPVKETPSVNISVNNTVAPPTAYIPPPVNNTIIYGNVNNGNINSNNNTSTNNVDPNPPPYVDPNVSATYGTNYAPQFVPAPAPYGSYPPPNVPSAPPKF